MTNLTLFILTVKCIDIMDICRWFWKVYICSLFFNIHIFNIHIFMPAETPLDIPLTPPRNELKAPATNTDSNAVCDPSHKRSDPQVKRGLE